MRIGIFGTPASGRSTIFKLLVGARSGAGSGVMEGARTGVIKVPDPRLDVLHGHFGLPKKVPVELQIFDFEPVVRGGDAGRGAASRVLAQLRVCDAMLLVVRGFEDPAVPHPEGTVDPARDVENLLLEMDLADMEIVERRLERIEESMKKGKKKEERDALQREAAILENFHGILDGGGSLRDASVMKEEERVVSGFGFLSWEPTLVVLNVGDDGLGGGLATQLAGRARGLLVAEVAGKLEAEIGDLPEGEREEFMESLGVDVPGRDRVLWELSSVLNTISFFTIGKDEVRAWAVRKGADAVEAAGRVHTDMARGFIRAEVVAFEDFSAAGSMQAVKEQGNSRLEGRDYIVQDGDIINFRFNV